MARFDFGTSLIDERPVAALIAEALPRTLLLTSLALLFTYLLAVPLGIYSALHPHTQRDRALSSALFLLYALPPFWVALDPHRPRVCGISTLLRR